MKMAVIIFGFLLSLCLFFSEAKAAPVGLPNIQLPVIGSTLVINKIAISGMSLYQGKYLTVYYGTGARASLASAKNQVNIREVKVAETFPINNNILELPKRDFARSGFVLPYNLIVVVVHDTPTFCWKNKPNDQFPLGEKTCSENTSVEIDSLTKTEFDILLAAQNDPEVVMYSFGAIISESNR
jgi:hypothetical protein